MGKEELNENPLDEYAAKASRQLLGQSADVSHSNVERVESGQVSLRDSFARHVQAAAIYMEDAAAGVLKAGSLEAKDAAIGAVFAESVQATTLHTGVLAAKAVEGREVRTGLLFAINIRGDVYSALSPVAGLAIGAGFAVGFFLMRFAWKMAQRRLSPVE
ncbi:MAG: hypothetical protein NZ553_10315 [Caldilinea sp.]|nr:hypothetical protein [Caldilinea sp.]MDW8440854.1 hypothetical protein [Caldilineaceae bacterium]